MKQRTDKQQKDRDKTEVVPLREEAGKEKQDLRLSGEISPSDFKMKESMKGSRMSRFEMLNYLNESIAEKPESELNDSKRSSIEDIQKEEEENKPFVEDKL